jgi:DNA phosphorothioation-dependent restriction protein DptG
MMNIELNKDGINGLEKRYFKNKTFSHVTGNQIKLLPFKTNPSGDTFSEDFKSFQGVIGELFRILNSKTQVELGKISGSFKLELKETILKEAIDKVDTEHKEEFKNMLTKLFFDEDHGLIKFNIRTLSYMNFINSNNAVKEISKFIFDLFLMDFSAKSSFNEDTNEENLLHQLIIHCLPELTDITSKSKVTSYTNLFPEIKEKFVEDFTYLSSNNSFLLKHIEDFFKYYYFHYLNQLLLQLKDFGTGTSKIKPIYYTMDWETLSEKRLLSHGVGWKQLHRYSESLFAHVNTLELLNYIMVDDKPIEDYKNIVNLFKSFSSEEKEKFKECIDELITFYTDNITVFDTGKNWDDCARLLEFALAKENFDDTNIHSIYTLWFKIKYQFENSSRSKPYSDYSKWYSQFGKVNYTKNRGRLGNTTILSQELLLFLTKICIGAEDKIRLKTLWDKFRERGIVFDETSKLEITKLFEKINLIEKKSDSGDAQYVKSTI